MSNALIPATVKLELVEHALNKFGLIGFCTANNFEKSFVLRKGKVEFWFNDAEQSTHVVSKTINKIGN